jgi:hypothetical protein
MCRYRRPLRLASSAAGHRSPVTPSASCAAATASPIAAAGSDGARWPHQVGGLDHVVIRSGDLVRRVNERWADEYRVVASKDG